MRTLSAITLTLVALGLSGCSDSKQTNTAASAQSKAVVVPDRDNTAVNERDRDAAAKTPLDQNENQADLDVTANIRKKIVASDMSVNAQNIKIITQNGKVTLRGPVKSEAEKTRIEELALAVAGRGNVDNQLEVEA